MKNPFISLCIAALLIPSTVASAFDENEYGLYMPHSSIRTIERISSDHDTEETFLILEARTKGCETSEKFSVLYYKADTNRSGDKSSIIEFCSVSSLGVGRIYTGYFQGKTKKGLLVLPPDAIFFTDGESNYRVLSYQVHSLEFEGKNIYIGGIEVTNLHKSK